MIWGADIVYKGIICLLTGIHACIWFNHEKEADVICKADIFWKRDWTFPADEIYSSFNERICFTSFLFPCILLIWKIGSDDKKNLCML